MKHEASLHGYDVLHNTTSIINRPKYVNYDSFTLCKRHWWQSGCKKTQQPCNICLPKSTVPSSRCCYFCSKPTLPWPWFACKPLTSHHTPQVLSRTINRPHRHTNCFHRFPTVNFLHQNLTTFPSVTILAAVQAVPILSLCNSPCKCYNLYCQKVSAFNRWQHIIP